MLGRYAGGGTEFVGADMSDRIQSRQEDAHFRILRLLQDDPTLTQRQIADGLGISLGRLNYCLKALLDKGWIKIQNFQGSERKLAYAYLLTPSGVAEKSVLAARFLRRKLQEYEQLKTEIDSLQKEIERPVTVRNMSSGVNS